MRRVAVTTSTTAYDILIGSGLLAQLKDLIGDRKQSFVLTVPEVWARWSGQFLQSFNTASEATPRVLFARPGESAKSLVELERLAEELLSAGADRSALLITFGGGVIGDLGGFLASIYMRGIPYVQVPSTLLAQVDASVGGKTAVNLSSGKNLLGSFHHPAVVVIDPDLLQTLDDRQFRAGLYESLRAAVTLDAAFFSLLEQQAPAVLARDRDRIEQIIARSVELKAHVVGVDEKDDGLRMILNFGHTLGHAIEVATGYGTLLHGEAVAWGMLAATHLSLSRGLLSAVQSARIEKVLNAYGPLPPFCATAVALRRAISRDKKRRTGVLRFVLVDGIGSAVVRDDISENELTGTIDSLLKLATKSGKGE